MTAPDLKPCPFCGEAQPPHDDTSWVRCLGCGAETGWQATGADAIAAWNTRTPLAEAHPLAAEARMALERDDVAGWIGSLPKAPLADALVVPEVAALVETPFGQAANITGMGGGLMLVSVIGKSGIVPKRIILPHQLYLRDILSFEAEGAVVVTPIPNAGGHVDVSAALRAIGERANG